MGLSLAELQRRHLINEARRETMMRTLTTARAQAAALQSEPQYVEPFGLMRLPHGVMVVYRRRDGSEQVYASSATEALAHRLNARISNSEHFDEAV